MNNAEILQQVAEGKLNPKDAAKQLQSHGTYIKDVEIDLDRRALKVGLPTFEYYEYLLSNRGNMVTMAARAGNGKTALATQIGLHVAQTKKVLFFSLEMNKESIVERLISVQSEIPIRKLREDSYAKEVKKSHALLSDRKFKIIDTPKLTISQVTGMVYDENRIEPVGLVIIDYIGLLSADKSDKRHLEISEIASRIKTDIADKLSIPVLVLAQMNQGIDNRLFQAEALKARGKDLEVRPMLSDMGESKGIADASDVVMFLRRPCLYDPEEPRNLFKVYVVKNRNGTTQDFDLQFSEESTKFFDNSGKNY